MSEPGFAVYREGPIAEIVLCRPQAANSLTEDFWIRFPEAIRELDQAGSVRAAIIRGEGANFSSGIDVELLERFLGGDDDVEPGRFRASLRLMLLRMHEVMSAMEQARFPIIAAIHGACIGGALDLVCACDLRLAATGAYFSIQEIQMGMVADLGVLQRLSALIPPGIVRELAMTGRRMPAEEAHRFGFANAMASDADGTVAAARALADDIASKSPLAIWGTKEILNDFDRRRIEDGLRYTAAWNTGMFMPEDVQRSVAAARKRAKASYRDLLDVDYPAVPRQRTTVKE